MTAATQPQPRSAIRHPYQNDCGNAAAATLSHSDQTFGNSDNGHRGRTDTLNSLFRLLRNLTIPA
ncbi:hypothetical [Yersinia pestis KIM10+]|uniref:Uncharacterized protein n=1 Tax=Yersinia pestis TaxID=632 RepID=Q8CKG2_YERPE|nr:hypothetical [Yersinia pestis KIM10+]